MKIAFALVGLIVMCTAGAHAETATAVPTSVPATSDSLDESSLIANSGRALEFYCVWRNKLYSVGAVFCTERSGFVQCMPGGAGSAATWKFDRTGDCDPNPALTPN